MNRVLAGGALVIFIVAIAVIALTSGGSKHSGTPVTTAVTSTRATTGPRPPTAPKPVAVRLAPVGPYNPPPGDGTENDAQVANAVDGNATTFWSTEHYSSPFGSYKKGVGIVLDAGRRRRLTRVVVGTDHPGARAQIRLADVPTGPYRTVSADRVLTGTTAFTLSRTARGRYVLVWITALPPSTGEAHITEVRALGT